MLLRQYEDFILRQCAVCSVELPSERKVDTLNLSKNDINSSCSPETGDNCIENQKEDKIIKTMEAISYIFGLSKDSIVSKLVKLFQKVHKAEKELLPQSNETKTAFEDFTKIVFCENCAILVRNIYQSQKHFARALADNSLMFNILGADIYKKLSFATTASDDSLKIKTEPEDFSESERLQDVDDYVAEAEDFAKIIKIENSDDNLLQERSKKDKSLLKRKERRTKEKKKRSITKRKSYAKTSAYNEVKIEGTVEMSQSENPFPQRLVVSIERMENTDENKQLLQRAKLHKAAYSTELPLLKPSGRKLRGNSKTAVKGVEKHEQEKLQGDMCSDSESDFDFSDSHGGDQDDYGSSDDVYTSALKTAGRRKTSGERKPKNDGKNSRRRISKVCDLCGLKFNNFRDVYEHEAASHANTEITVHPESTSGPPFNCPKCPNSWLRFNSLKFHCLRVHSLRIALEGEPQNLISCPECDGKFSNLRGCMIHLRKIHGSQYSVCDICDKPFPSLAELNSHLSSVHPTSERVKAQDGEQYSINERQFCSVPYFCRVCSFRCQYRNGIFSHNRRFHENARKYDCKDCEESFGSTAALVAHLTEIHQEIIKPETDEDQHTCTECGTEFNTNAALVKHLKTTGHKKYFSKCPFCEMTFTETDKLKIHKRTEHRDKVITLGDTQRRQRTKEKIAVLDKLSNYQCPFCELQFESKEESNQHKITHDKDSLYRCPSCPKTFVKEFTFNRHRILTHFVNQEQSHQCEKCGKYFKRPKTLRAHMNQHLELEKGETNTCHICGNNFSTVKYLRKHINVRHLGKQVQQCDTCGYVARTSWAMKCHMQVHEKNGQARKRKPKLKFQQGDL